MGTIKVVRIHFLQNHEGLSQTNLKDADLFHRITEKSGLVFFLDEISGDDRSRWESSPGEHECLHKIRSKSIKLLLRHFSPKWWSNWQTKQNCHHQCNIVILSAGICLFLIPFQVVKDSYLENSWKKGPELRTKLTNLAKAAELKNTNPNPGCSTNMK